MDNVKNSYNLIDITTLFDKTQTLYPNADAEIYREKHKRRKNFEGPLNTVTQVFNFIITQIVDISNKTNCFKEKKYTQKYSKQWEQDENLKAFSIILNWIAPDPTGNCQKAYCKYCRTILVAHKKDLGKHAISIKHKNAVDKDKQAKLCRPINVIKPPNNKLDNLTELLKKIEPDSNVFSKMKLHRTKCAALIKNILSPCMLEDLVNDMKKSPYSLIMNECTDISTEKILCIMVRYFSFKKKELLTTFYGIVTIVDATANGIHSALKLQLEADGLSLKNLVGIGVDGANVMVGVNHSVSSLLKQEVPDIVIIKCICHSLHLCAEKAAETLPRQLEYLVREAHNWFSNSPKRKDEYKKLNKVMNSDEAKKNPKKIAGLSGTRKDFLVKLCTEIQERLPMNISILKSTNVLTPTYATSQRKPDLSKLLEQFTRESLYGSKDNIIKEWNILSHKQWDNTNETVSFWSEVYEDRDSGSNRRFENVSKFALALLTTPISNADIERAFSIYDVIKDKLRNKLALRNGSEYHDGDYEQCTSFVPTKEMLSRFTVHMYDFKNDTEKVSDVEFQELLDITNAI
ncbi:Similar to ZNF862: Zinc finger protein 862 (Homo sapiens) [Cotesia congregata]|uniref:Similar to ZNF862: Zinc finger protein 862 (Homo sapiens) n=1 Tax=Cotesia congregata TaxID=51543 RepID=A0A8J2EB99_COTCN|nr:Similar to ZNF862: Zinc finger protein 862 (Homo sapiens) [Cotesia congregata]